MLAAVTTGTGIFGPAGHQLGNAAGFRGWSGGARAGFMLPVVLNPLGMDWQAQIVLTRGVQPSLLNVPATRPAVRRRRQAGWYRGDLHTHTVHSDGRRRIEEMAEAVTSAGLDFIVSTDHNTNSANRAWAVSTGGELEVIAGEEVTTRHGHWLAVGLPPGGWVDWRYTPRDGVFAGYAATTTLMPWRSGTACGMSMTNCRCASGISYYGRAAGSPRSAVATRMCRINPVGRPQTVVYAQELSTPALIDGLRRNRCYLTESSAVTLVLSASHAGGTATAGPGETLSARSLADVTVTAEVSGARDCSIALVTDGGCVGRVKTDACGKGTLTWTASAGEARFARVEVRRRTRFPSMVALSNPVWLDSTD